MTESSRQSTPGLGSETPSNDEWCTSTIEDFNAFCTSTDINDMGNVDDHVHDWSTSFYGLSTKPISAEIADILHQKVHPMNVKIKPAKFNINGRLYLPDTEYTRILDETFGSCGWGLVPRGKHFITSKNISREYALICQGRYVTQARGEKSYIETAGLSIASEAYKSNALVRCCNNLRVASQLQDPVFIKKFKTRHCTQVWAKNTTTNMFVMAWRKKNDELEYPYQEINTP